MDTHESSALNARWAAPRPYHSKCLVPAGPSTTQVPLLLPHPTLLCEGLAPLLHVQQRIHRLLDEGWCAPQRHVAHTQQEEGKANVHRPPASHTAHQSTPHHSTAHHNMNACVVVKTCLLTYTTMVHAPRAVLPHHPQPANTQTNTPVHPALLVYRALVLVCVLEQRLLATQLITSRLQPLVASTYMHTTAATQVDANGMS